MLTIQRAQLSDTPIIVTMMEEALSLLPDSSWYVPDNEDFVYRHIQESGFVLNGFWDGTLAGFLMVRFPQEEEDNLGYSLISEWANQKLNPSLELFCTAHIESVVVRPPFRGHQIQSKLIAEAITILKKQTGLKEHIVLKGQSALNGQSAFKKQSALEKQNFRHVMATVHPENKASLISFQKNGFQILATVKKYGGLDRHILYKAL